EARNSDEMRRLRLDMLAGKESPQCGECYQVDALSGLHTVRRHMNQHLGHHSAIVEATQKDGRIPDARLPALDIGLSNLCNFKCRTCGPLFSSSWHEDAVTLQLHPARKFLDPIQDFERQVEPMLACLEWLDFGG